MEGAKGDGEERLSGGPCRPAVGVRAPCRARAALRAWLASVRRRVRRVKFLFAWIWGLGVEKTFLKCKILRNPSENCFEVYEWR